MLHPEVIKQSRYELCLIQLCLVKFLEDLAQVDEGVAIIENPVQSQTTNIVVIESEHVLLFIAFAKKEIKNIEFFLLLMLEPRWQMATFSREDGLLFEVLIEIAIIQYWTETLLKDLNGVLRVSPDEIFKASQIIDVATDGALINLESNLVDDVFNFSSEHKLWILRVHEYVREDLLVQLHKHNSVQVSVEDLAVFSWDSIKLLFSLNSFKDDLVDPLVIEEDSEERVVGKGSLYELSVHQVVLTRVDLFHHDQFNFFETPVDVRVLLLLFSVGVVFRLILQSFLEVVVFVKVFYDLRVFHLANVVFEFFALWIVCSWKTVTCRYPWVNEVFNFLDIGYINIRVREQLEHVAVVSNANLNEIHFHGILSLLLLF